jgi:hypothetical protein
MDANNKAMQERKEAKMKEAMERQIGSLVSIMEADRKTDRRNKTRNKSRPKTHARDDENQSRKDEAAIQSMRSELDETIRHQMENVMTCVTREMQNLHKEVTEKIEKKKTGGITGSRGVPRCEGKEAPGRLVTIRSNHLRDYNLTHIKVQATINETCSETETTNMSSSLGWK